MTEAPRKIHHRQFDSGHERRKNRRHRERHQEHRHNPCPHRPRQLDADSEIYAEFQRHPHPFTASATDAQRAKLAKGRKRHNGWVARIRWEEVDTDTDGFPITVVRYQVEVELSADGTDWFFASRHHTPAKDDCDPGEADHIIIHHIHGNLAYRFRVRALGRDCKADWSDYYVMGTPDDTPPAPFDVRILRAPHGIRLRWHADTSVDDDEIFCEDIAYFVAELWTNNDFGPVLDFTATNAGDLFTTTTHGMSDGDHVMISGTDGGQTLPDGTHPWKVYRVDVQSSTTFKLVHDESGNPVTLTSDGDGQVHIGLIRKSRHAHKHHHKFRVDVQDFDEDHLFYGRVRSHSDHKSKSAWIPATGDGNDDPDATPSGRRPLWHRHGGLTFTIPGKVEEKIYAVPARVEDDYLIRRVTAAANIAGSGGPTRFDIKVNGGPYVFGLNTGDEVTLAAGDHDGTSKAIHNDTLSRGDHIRVRCTTAPSHAPRNVTIHIVADRLSPQEFAATDSGGGGGQELILLAAKGRSQTTSNLYNIDPALASETSIGAVGFALTAIYQDPSTGIVYGSTSNNSASNPHSLITIDPFTGAGTFVAGWANAIPMPGFAINSAGVAYGLQGSGSSNLQLLNLTDGTQTPLAGGPGGFNLAFDDNDVLWYFFSSGEQGTVDTTTGDPTPVWSVPFTNMCAVTILDGVAWIVDNTSSTAAELFTLDLSDGTLTDIGAFSTTYIDALGWVVA